MNEMSPEVHGAKSAVVPIEESLLKLPKLYSTCKDELLFAQHSVRSVSSFEWYSFSFYFSVVSLKYFDNILRGGRQFSVTDPVKITNCRITTFAEKSRKIAEFCKLILQTRYI